MELYILKFPIYLWIIFNICFKHRKIWDGIWITDFTPITHVIILFARLLNIPVFLYIRGDQTKEIVAQKYTGIKALLSSCYLKYMELFTPKVLSYVNTIFAGQALEKKFAQFTKSSFSLTVSALNRRDIDGIKISFRPLTREYIRILYVGNLVPIKGLETLIMSLSDLRDLGVKFHATIVGTGPLQQSLENLSKQKGIMENVSFKGHVPFGNELFSIYKSSDIYVLPSFSEGSPKTVSEAMAFGLPVVASNVGGIPYIVHDKIDGVLFPPGDVESLTKAIAYLQSNPEVLRQMSIAAYSNGKDLVEEVQVGRLSQFLRQCVDNK